ncbi:MAG TPA: DUF2442 domain-containing protein [Ktedonobacteraceae bacterium]|nr:DUF2442 domain-containing protein [Ktedonobacteraceae bacterium]
MDIMRYGGSAWRNVKLAPIAKDVHFDNERMYILFADGRELSVLLKWFPILLHATSEQRSKWELFNKGTSLRWDEIDEDIAIPPLLGLPDD